MVPDNQNANDPASSEGKGGGRREEEKGRERGESEKRESRWAEQPEQPSPPRPPRPPSYPTTHGAPSVQAGEEGRQTEPPGRGCRPRPRERAGGAGGGAPFGVGNIRYASAEGDSPP